MHTWRNGSRCVRTKNKKSDRTSIQHLECEKMMNPKIDCSLSPRYTGEKEEAMIPTQEQSA